MFNFLSNTAAKIMNIITQAGERITDEEFIVNEIKQFKVSQKRTDMLNGERYYNGVHDILSRKRTVIGEGGKLEEVENLPNNRIVDNQYKKMVIQKTNYIAGQPFSVQCENEQYSKHLNLIFNKRFPELWHWLVVCSL